MRASGEFRPFDFTLHNMFTQTIGYVTTSIIAHSTTTALGAWGPFMSATFLGSLALYFPLRWTIGTLLVRDLLTPFVSSLVSTAFQIALPLIGAALLNFGLAGTIPLWPCLICALIGVATTRLLHTFYVNDDQPANAELTPPASLRPPSSALQLAHASREARAAGIRVLSVFPAHVNARPHFPPQDNPRQSSVVIEELDDEGNTIGVIPSSFV